jgi:two-component system nitrate/nitrite response regulator NarL
MIGVVVIGSIRLYREGLADLLGKQDGFAIVGSASDLRDDLAAATASVILLDMATPESYACAKVLRARYPSTPIVAIGIDDVETEILACAEVGAAAYVAREGSIDELVAAIRGASRGEFNCSSRMAGTLVRRLAALATAKEADLPAKRLTRREREIAALLQQDLSNKEIAVRLRIEVATVKNHVHNLLDKLNTHSRVQASRLLSQPDPLIAHRTRS